MVHAVHASGNLRCLRLLMFNDLIMHMFALDIFTPSYYPQVLNNTPTLDTHHHLIN
jgi:hypothetical protein